MIEIRNIQGTEHRIQLRKLVVKLGSAVIAGEGTAVDMPMLAGLARSIAKLRGQGVEVVVVSSGAIGVGRQRFPGIKSKTIPDRQALAAVGQVGLMHAYKEVFNAEGFAAAQVLLTRGDMEDRRRYLNARYTLERLLELGAVPVINENDSTTVEELKFGDNDELSALVATKMDADALVILSVVDGLLPVDAAGHVVKHGELIRVVEKVDSGVHGMAGIDRSSAGTGGMQTKLAAMAIASHAGVHGVIANGKRTGILEAICSGDFHGTYFAAAEGHRVTQRQRWVAYGRKPRGVLAVDDGASRALVEGKKSLLAVGVKSVEGAFAPGDMVEIVNGTGECLARGLVNYSTADLERIKGMKTAQIKAELGSDAYTEVVHRDNLVMLG